MFELFALSFPLPENFRGIKIPDDLVGKTLDEIRLDRKLFLTFLEAVYGYFEDQI